MKTPTLLAWLLVWMNIASLAQDTLVYKNGRREPVRVLEVGEFSIRFKNADNPSGPDRVVGRTDLQSIHYQNGTTEEFRVQGKAEDPQLIRRLRMEEELGNSKLAFFAEIGGAGILSVNGDYRIYKDALAPLAIHARVGGGIAPGRDNGITLPVTLSVVTGRLYKFEMGGGITPAFGSDKAELIYSALIGFRYQRKNGLFGRAAFTPLIDEGLRGFEINPFVGLAIGLAY